jgi:diguanylate cyclase (GGDEF)-like protein
MTVASVTAPVFRAFQRLRAAAPRGDLLPDDIWLRRHRVIVFVLWLHVPALAAIGLFSGLSAPHVAVEVGAIAAAALLARSDRYGRTLQATFATLGLVTSSAVLVHFSGGYVEAHFHFFVMLGVITLYQSWVPFILAIAYVLVHHGVLGTLDPAAVYNHPDAIANPWKWAVVHAAFVLASSIAYLAAWRLTEHQALHDHLTGLPNRMLFRDRVTQAASRVARQDTGLAVLLLDIDDFKKVNDTLGHAAGDRLLTDVATRLVSAMRSNDSVARLGGDEFAILVDDGGGDAKTVLRVIDRILAALEPAFDIGGTSTRIGVSVGVAVGTRGDCSVDELVRRADVAMYEAKANGKGGYVVFGFTGGHTRPGDVRADPASALAV